MTDVDVVVVGAGIAGLATAWRLQSRGLDVLVLEDRSHVGGRMVTECHDGFVVDTGADGLLDGYTSTEELVEALGLRQRIVPLDRPTAGVWRDGRVHVVPQALTGLHRFGAIGWTAKARAAGLLGAAVSRARGNPKHDAVTVAQLAHRLHPELLAYAFEPCVKGLFGWDPAISSVGPFLDFVTAARGSFRMRTYDSGMDAMARSLSALVRVERGVRVERVHESAGGVEVAAADGRSWQARGCVAAIPAPLLREIVPDRLRPAYADASAYTRQFCVTVFTSTPVRSPVYGLTFPSAEEDLLAWAAVESAKPGRVPADKGMVRLTAVGRQAEALAALGGDEGAATLVERGARYFPELTGSVEGTTVHYWKHALPAFPLGAMRLRPDFLDAPPGAVEYAGDWVGGPSSEGAIRSSARAADRVVAALEVSRAGAH